VENPTNVSFNLNSVKASIVECAKVAGSTEGVLKESDFDTWQNDYSKSWQVRFMYDLQCLQKAINLIDSALLQKDLLTVDDALRDAVIRSSSLASTFEYITRDLMHLRHVLKDAAISSNSEH
jgi:hypothetical protein